MASPILFMLLIISYSVDRYRVYKNDCHYKFYQIIGLFFAYFMKSVYPRLFVPVFPSPLNLGSVQGQPNQKTFYILTFSIRTP